MVDQCTLLLSNLRIETHHHHKIVGTSVPFPVACLLSQLRISTNELLNHLAGWRLLCICDLCLLIMCEPSQANSFHCDTTIFTFSARNDMCVQHSTPIVGGANVMFGRDRCYPDSCIFCYKILQPHRLQFFWIVGMEFPKMIYLIDVCFSVLHHSVGNKYKF